MLGLSCSRTGISCEMLFYQTLLGGCFLGLKLLEPIIKRFSRRVRQGSEHFSGNLPTLGGRPGIWLHGVSMGETSVALHLTEELKRRMPGLKAGFTTTHPDVLAMLQKSETADSVAYFPLDLVPFADRALNRQHPAVVILSETDFWPAFCHICSKRKIPLVLVNGRISEGISRFYTVFKGLSSAVFDSFSLFLVQTELDRSRLVSIGVDEGKIFVAGNIKADMISRTKPGDLIWLNQWVDNKPLVVFGSLHPSELKLLQPAIASLAKSEKVKIVIAPRNIPLSTSWKADLTELGISTILRSEISGLYPNESRSDLMILNSMGELNAVYAAATAAFIGGTLDPSVGGHNPLEIVAHGVPLLSGPNFRNFSDLMAEFSAEEAFFPVTSPADLLLSISHILGNPEMAGLKAAMASAVLNRNKGATARSVERILPLIHR